MNRKLCLFLFQWLKCFIGLLIIATLFACSSGKNKEEMDKSSATELPVNVSVIAAGQGQSAGEIIVAGTLEPVNQTEVACQEGGIVQKIHVEIGDRVKKGDALASLDPTDFELGVKQAEAVYQGAKIVFETTEKDYQRFTKLRDEGSISPADYEKAELSYKAAKHALEQADVMKEAAHNRLRDSVVRAPYSGQITHRLVSLGSYVDPMMHPVMFVMVDNSRLRVTLNLPEVRAALIKQGDEAIIYIPTEQRHLKVKIDVITDSVDPITHTRTAVAWINNTGKDPLPSGIFFEARIVPSFLVGKILLPSSALRTSPDGKITAYVVEQKKALLRELTGSFLADQSEFIVESGISQGDKVILEASMVRDGQSVVVSGAEAHSTGKQVEKAEEGSK